MVTSVLPPLSGMLSDRVVFPMTQLVLIGFGIYAAWKDAQPHLFPRRGVVTVVKRGPESRGFFTAAFAGLSVLVTLLVQITTAWPQHRVATCLFDYAVLAYLCYFNAWSRNKIVGIVIWWRDTPG